MRFFANTMVLGLVCMMGMPSQAWAFRAQNDLNVYPAGDARFEVIQRPGAGPSDIWCAAGDYARRALGAAAAQPVYLVAGRQTAVTQANRIGITFSLQRPPEADNFKTKPLTLSMQAIGDNLTASFAQQYCYSGLGDEKRLFP